MRYPSKLVNRFHSRGRGVLERVLNYRVNKRQRRVEALIGIEN